jgi:uncharacterized protein involved in exopolysaccharide biosynthesis
MSENNFSSQNVPVPSNMSAPPALHAERLLLRDVSPANGLRDYLSLFFKRKFGILISFVLLCALSVSAAVIYNYYIYTPKFEPRALVLVKTGWENYSTDFSLENRRAPSLNQTDIVGSESRILESRELKERVINSLKPENIYPFLAKDPIPGLSNNEAALMLLERDLTITAGKKGNVVEVSLKGSDPGRMAAVVNQLVSFYIDKRSEIYKDPKSVLFLEKKAEEYRQKLADAENRLKAFREETKIIAFDEQRTGLLNQRSSLVGTLNGTGNQIKEIQERISELEKQLAVLPKTSTTLGATERAGDAESRLLNLQLQEKELIAKYKEDNRLVTNIRNQIEMVKAYQESQSEKKKPGSAPADPVYQDIYKQILQNKAELSALKVRNTATEQQLGELNTEIQTFEARENRNKELLRDIASNDEKYRTYRQRLEEARIYDELDRQKMTSVSLIESASAPLIPTNPPKPLMLLIIGAVVFSIAGSLGLAYLREFLKQGMSTPTEVERRLDLPVLLAIPIK